MSGSPEVVVAGAGHNSLITAAYLARAGYSVVVLDARPIPGGGAASEEMLGPGYLIDSCSTGHTLIQTNPLLVDDELGLLERYGLEYIQPDPFAHVAFPDGRQLTMWLDLERSHEELSRFSRRDADAYLGMLREYDAVKEVFGAVRFTPPGFGPTLAERLQDHVDGRRWLRRSMMSAWDVIRSQYESPHVQAFMLWQAFQTLVPVDSAGSGPLAYSIVFGRQRRSWTLPRGGSGRLAEALVRVIEDNGGAVLCNRLVTRLVLEGGRCVGVETEDGERHMASRAVVSTTTLVDPSRAPEGRHTVKFLSGQAWQLPEGETGWEELKHRQADRQLERVRRFAPNLTDQAILATLVKSPPDIEHSNRHMIHGTFHGGDRGLAQSGSLRPAPGWGQHRMPIPGLYQTGGTTHPGGSITGAPGRNAAMVILGDLGTSLEEVIERSKPSMSTPT